MLYLTWYEDNKKIPVSQRIADGIAAYAARFGHAPNVVAVNTDEPADERVTARMGTIQRNNYWFSFDPAAPQSPQSGA